VNLVDSVLIPTDFVFGCDDDLIGPESAISILDDDTVGIANMFSVQNCDCDNGMTQITLQYVGDWSASKILGFYSVMNTAETPLKDCEFLNVQKGDTITCSAGAYGTFKRKTRFEVYYDGNDNDEADCIGDAKTKCDKMSVGKSLKNCADLVVVSHVDGDGAFCDADVLSFDVAIRGSNAFVGNDRRAMSPSALWEELDLWIRWMLICLLVAFTALITISCFLCALQRRARTEQREKERKLDDIMKQIAMKKWRKSMSWGQRRGETRASNERIAIQTHQVQTHHVVQANSSQFSSDSSDELDTETGMDTSTTTADDDEDLEYAEEYYLEDQDILTAIHHDNGTDCEYAE